MANDQLENDNTGEDNGADEQNVGTEGAQAEQVEGSTDPAKTGDSETEQPASDAPEKQPEPVAKDDAGITQPNLTPATGAVEILNVAGYTKDTPPADIAPPATDATPAPTDAQPPTQPPVIEQAPTVATDPVQAPKPEDTPPPPTEPTLPPPTPSVVEEEVITLPVPKSTAGTKATITKNTDLPKQSVGLDKITIDELVKRKHDFNLSEAGGMLLDTLNFLDRYENSMKASLEVPATAGESLQKQMYKIYLQIFALESTKERDVAMEVLLWKFFKDEKGAFGVTQLSRFTRQGRWHTQELNMYLQLNHIFYSSRNPLDRIQRLKDFKLPAIVGGFPADKIRYTEQFLNWVGAIR